MISAGELRHTVAIEKRSTTQDAVGEPLNEWVHFARRRAGIVRTPGREVFASDQRTARVPTVFRLRHLEGVLPAMRLVCASKVYDIVAAIDPDGRREQLLITAEEHVEATP